MPIFCAQDDKLARLREERLARERAERVRTEKLTKPHTDYESDMSQAYVMPFSPDGYPVFSMPKCMRTNLFGKCLCGVRACTSMHVATLPGMRAHMARTCSRLSHICGTLGRCELDPQ